jgi:uncharacterized protein YwgA
MDGRISLIVENLRRLRAGRIDTFAQRLRNQKIHYLLQEADLSPNVPYNLYLRGPYSPELARITYETPKSEPIKGFAFSGLERRFTAIRTFIRSLTTRELELLTTYHWLIEHAAHTPQDAQKELSRLKAARDEEIERTAHLLEAYSHVISEA